MGYTNAMDPKHSTIEGLHCVYVCNVNTVDPDDAAYMHSHLDFLCLPKFP